MNLKILCDINWESKVDHAVKVIDKALMSDRDYGDEIDKIVVILNCRSPELEHQQRIRFAKKERIFYVDVMLNLAEFVRSTHVARRRRIFEELTAQLRDALHARKLRNFRVDEFMSDLSTALDLQLNGPESNRFDANCLEVASGY